MPERLPFLFTLVGSVTIAAMLTAAPAVHAQKIICWKDSAGKVIGCGDRVPPEFQKNESKTLDNRGITRQTNVSAEEAARLREEEKKQAALKVEEDRRLSEQKRQDDALINTYISPKEIDIRRDRELQVVDLQIQQLQGARKSAADAHTNQQKRYATFEKSGRPIPDSVKEDLNRATEEKARIEARVADKEKDKEQITANYAKQKARYQELKGGPSASTSPADAKPAVKK